MSKMYFGVVENRNDPLMLGRCKVRVVGKHSDNKVMLPTEDLPWATPILPITSASISGIGQAPVGPVEGSWVAIQFLDDEFQNPVMIGTVPGIPGGATNLDEVEDFSANNDTSTPPAQPTVIKTESGGILVDSDGNPVLSTTTKTVSGDDTAKTLAEEAQAKANRQIVHIVSSGKGYIIVKYNDNTVFKREGSRNWRNNNPGNMNYGNYTQGKGAIGSDGRFAVFPTLEIGRNAKRDLLFVDNVKQNYKNLSLSDALYKYAPPKENDTEGYINYLVIKTGIGRDTILNTLSVDQQNAMIDAMATKEGGANKVIETPLDDETLNSMPSDTPINQPIPEQPKVATVEAPQQPTPAQGFQDPNNKYPLKGLIGEPDTNRLARNQGVGNTSVGDKERDREISIEMANTTTKWDQPQIPYNAMYPYNHAYVSESGHVMEFDDTEKSERINIYHKMGTFIEIDHNGTQVNRIVGNGVEIIEADGLVYIKGTGSITVDGDFGLRTGGNGHIQIDGDANVNISGNANIKTYGDMNLNCKNFKLTASGDIDLISIGSTRMSNIKTDINSLSSVNIQSAGVTSIHAGGNFNVDGTQIQLNSGMSNTAEHAFPASEPDSWTPALEDLPVRTRHEQAAIEYEMTDKGGAMMSADPNPEKDIAATGVADTTIPTEQPRPVISPCDILPPYTLQTMLTTNVSIKDVVPGQGGGNMVPVAQHNLSQDIIVCNLKQLSLNIIEPIKAKYPKMDINSCFRRAGSGISKSSNISQHELGMAIDIGLRAYAAGSTKSYHQIIAEFAIWVKDNLPFDQLIYEYTSKGSVWLHISFNPKGNRPLSDPNKIITLYNNGPKFGGFKKQGIVAP